MVTSFALSAHLELTIHTDSLPLVLHRFNDSVTARSWTPKFVWILFDLAARAEILYHISSLVLLLFFEKSF